MAYTNAIFYLDYVNGSDATRSTLTPVVCSNSGGLVNVNYVGHGQVTGAVGTLASVSNNTGAWKITVVDADNFTLDGSVWSAMADSSGTWVPFGGGSWADAWKTLTSGATSSRTAAGDTIRCAKSPAPISVGNALWTDNSKTVTLTAASTLLIDSGSAGWTAANAATVTHVSALSKGAYTAAVSITKATFAANTLYAYKTIASTDYSIYDAITFWCLASTSAVTNSTTWLICLCSDTAGAVVVDSFPITGGLGIGTSVAETLTRTGGGTLGIAIQSIAIYSGNTVPTAASVFRINQFHVCTSTGLSLTKLISKNPLEEMISGDEPWCQIASIEANGLDLTLDGNYSTNLATAYGKYGGTTETVETYIRDVIMTGWDRTSYALSNTQWTTNRSGTSTAPLTISGGWNTSNTIQDGETILMNTGTQTNITISQTWVNLSRFGFFRGYANMYISGGFMCNISVFTGGGGQYWTYNSGQGPCYITYKGVHGENTQCQLVGGPTEVTGGIIQGSASFYIASQNSVGKISNLIFRRNFSTIVQAVTDVLITSIEVINLTGALISASSLNLVVCKNLLFTGAYTIVSFSYTHGEGRVQTINENNSGTDYIYYSGGTINNATTTRTGGTGKMWKLLTSNTVRASYLPLSLYLSPFAVKANKQVSVKAWMKKDHATQCNGRLAVRGGQIAGVDNNVTATLADNTDWQLLELTFTPTEDGVVMLEAWAEYVSGHQPVYIDEVYISQAI